MNIHPYYQQPIYKSIDRGLVVAYLATGALVTLSDFAAFTILFSGVHAGLLAATVGAYFVGFVVSYMLNRFWVYRKTAERQSQVTSLWRYIAFLAFNLVLTYAMLWFMESTFAITPYIGKIIVNCFMFFWIYLGNAYFVFRGPKMGPIKL